MPDMLGVVERGVYADRSIYSQTQRSGVKLQHRNARRMFNLRALLIFISLIHIANNDQNQGMIVLHLLL